MNILFRLTVIISAATLAVAAQAKTVQATYATFASVIKTVQGGDTIDMIGNFELMKTVNYSFTSPLIINASQAIFHQTWSLLDDNNISIKGGLFDYRPANPLYNTIIEVYNGSNIFVDGGTFLDNGRSGGIDFNGTINVSVTNNQFSNMSNSVGIVNVNGAYLYNNLTVGATKDGFDIVGSQNVVASHNSCVGGVPAPGAHPDCIQIYSLTGLPASANITLSDNLAFGATQGFTKFDDDHPGENISILRNLVETSYPQGIACYGCVDSNISDNLLVTLSDATFRTNLNIYAGSDNTVTGNVFDDRRSLQISGDLPFRTAPGSIWYNAGVIPFTLSGAVPEPSIWVSLIAGFAAVGAALRRRGQRAQRPAFGPALA